MIDDVVVTLDFTGTHLNELVIDLIHPDGTIVALARNNLGAAQTHVVFGSGGIAAPGLAALNGKAIRGSWSVRVADTANADVSVLKGVAISIQPR